MNKKLLIVALALITAIAVPLVIAQVSQQTQTIHVTGSAKYPRNISTPTPSPAATTESTSTPTVAFSLWFPNGTSCPTTLTNLPYNIYGPLDSVSPLPATTQLVVRNDGSAPINISANAQNVNVPSNIQFTLASSMESNPIAPGQTADLYLTINMVTTNNNFAAGTPFTYSFDIAITAAQA